ncbi:hypothetical protein RhiirA1_395579 [Rhizophagus irregularis]|uniref:Uncharacterized protein n=1 Tax=Rhizophagus irregularis TaxID=588596 RepID=A0A2N0RP51_9GLOM|nr:hypothetical protein RhiirA1_395579 [Rhizophagus irregularis]
MLIYDNVSIFLNGSDVKKQEKKHRQVNIAPDDIVRDKLEYVIEEEIKNDFKGKMMISSFNLEKYFPVTDKKDEDDDNNNNIHIIVQFSATTEDILEKPGFSLIKSNKAITGYEPCEECDISILTEKPPRLIILNVWYDIIYQTCAKELIKKERYIAHVV